MSDMKHETNEMNQPGIPPENTQSSPETPAVPTAPTESVPTPAAAPSAAPQNTAVPTESPSSPVQPQQPQQPQQPTQPQPQPQPQPQYGAPNYTQPHPAQHVYNSYTPAPQPPKKQEKPKKKRTSHAGGIAVLVLCCLLVSGASGFFGAYLATRNYTPSTVNPSDGSDNQTPDGTSVIYQSASTGVGGMSSSGGKTGYHDVAAAVKDSVVEITTEFLVNSYFQYVAAGAGSGVIFSTDGYVITNNHVIADTENNNKPAESITVRLTNGKEYKATVVGSDADSDIAVLKIDAEEALPCAVIGNSDNLGVGEEVVAVGNPLGELGGTVTNGIISALNREINVGGTMMNLLQTNTAINPGNSGGGLFNMSGELIGIVNAKSSGSDIEGLGFAIPVNEAINVAEQLISKGYVSGKPYIGVGFYNVTNYSQALYYNLRALGVYVIELVPGYNDKVLELGDRVIAVDGTEISQDSDIATIVKSHKPGDTIPFSVYRDGKLIEVTVTCHEYVPTEENSIQFEKN